jgi:hypothetical protein
MIEPELDFQSAVLLIESGHPQDLLDGRTEGEALSAALKLAGIPYLYQVVSDSKTLAESLRRIAMNVRPRTIRIAGNLRKISFGPFIHFSSHGNEDGLGLTSGEFLPWDQLRWLLIELGKSTPYLNAEGNFISHIAFSSCMGSYARRIFSPKPPQPCFAIVGPDQPVEWADALTAFITYYHLLLSKKTGMPEAVRVMNEAAGLPDVFKYSRYTEYQDPLDH